MVNIEDVQADWTKVWTIEQIEHELTDFKFNGPGWYHSMNDTLLIFPIGEHKEPWKQTWKKHQRFKVMVYNERNPANAFNLIINAPTRD
jgi:hypothetical protein